MSDKPTDDTPEMGWTWTPNEPQHVVPLPDEGHVLIDLVCWCRPYADATDPEVIIHRKAVAYDCPSCLAAPAPLDAKKENTMMADPECPHCGAILTVGGYCDNCRTTPATPDLTDAQVEAIYAAYDAHNGDEARTIAGKRTIAEPIAAAVLAQLRDEFVALAPPAIVARIAVWRLLGGGDDDLPFLSLDALDEGR